MYDEDNEAMADPGCASTSQCAWRRSCKASRSEPLVEAPSVSMATASQPASPALQLATMSYMICSHPLSSITSAANSPTACQGLSLPQHQLAAECADDSMQAEDMAAPAASQLSFGDAVNPSSVDVQMSGVEDAALQQQQPQQHTAHVTDSEPAVCSSWKPASGVILMASAAASCVIVNMAHQNSLQVCA